MGQALIQPGVARGSAAATRGCYKGQRLLMVYVMASGSFYAHILEDAFGCELDVTSAYSSRRGGEQIEVSHETRAIDDSRQPTVGVDRG